MRTAFVATAFLALGAGVVDAHIHLTSPKSRIDTEIGDDQKHEPCGVTGQVRIPARVTTFRPGQTISVTWKETVDHKSHFRIAFQPSGDKFGIPPAGAGGGFPDTDQTGQTDATGALILKDMILDANTDTAATLTASITLPNMECNNCTLQFIQVMKDTPPYTVGDIYFNCADLTLSNSAPVDPPPGPGPTPDAGPTPDDPAATGGGSSGGCSTTSGQSGWLLLAFAAIAPLARRRRS